MDLKLFMCFVMISPIFGDNYNVLSSPQEMMEMDRARSAWNFGGHHPLRKAGLAQWGRQRTVSGSVIANRRQGVAPKPPGSGKSKKKSVRGTGLQSQPRQYKAYPKPVKPGKRSKLNRNSQSAPSLPLSRAPPSPTVPQSYYPHPFLANQPPKPPMSSWSRGSPIMQSRSDSIKHKFKKEDLWHLDKGEGYPLKNEDLLLDHLQRSFKVELDSNSIDGHHHHHQEEHEHDHTGNHIEEDGPAHFHHDELEQQAEHLINSAEHVVCNKNHKTGEDNGPSHIHHHHHYSDGKDSSHKEEKKPDDKKLTIAPLPRIHNPIPLGCLLTVPWFHPIRPRSHLACLLSIPGTPNLLKRRRRSADLDQQQQQLSLPPPPQSQSQIFQMFTGQRMPPPSQGSRKHYVGHVGNGKNPNSYPTLNSNLKVPATIIAPPQFEKGDLLSMLLGTGGVNPTDMGMILATNNRYVRYGRGLPSSGSGTGTRQGRNIRWFPDSSNNQIRSNNPSLLSPPMNRIPPQPMSSSQYQQQQPLPSSSNQAPSMVRTNQYSSQRPYPTPSLSPSSSPSLPSSPPPAYGSPQQKQQQQPSGQATPPLSLIVNVQITPMGSRPSPSRGPVITVPISSSQSQPTPIPSPTPSMPYQTVPVSSSSHKSKKYSEDFKYSDYWKPVTKGKSKPQKPYQYDYYQHQPTYSNNNDNDMYSSAESKLVYSKVKPSAEVSKELESYSYPIQMEDNFIVPVSAVEDYDSIQSPEQSPDYLLMGQSNSGTNDEINDSYSSNLGESSNKFSNNVKSYSFAVKKNSKQQDGFALDMPPASSASDYSDDAMLFSGDMRYLDSSSSINSKAEGEVDYPSSADAYGDRDQNADSSYYYSVVRKLAGNIVDPIIINVPKDDDALSNEIKK